MLNLPKVISIDRKQELAECKRLHTFWSLAAGHWGHCLMLRGHSDEPRGTGREEYSWCVVECTEGKVFDLLIWMIGQTVASRGSFWVQTFILTSPERPEIPVLFHTFLQVIWLDLSEQLSMMRMFRDWQTDGRTWLQGSSNCLGRAVILYQLVACKENSN